MSKNNSNSLMETGDAGEKFDDDGRIKRTGTMTGATAHIITAVIGSGILSLAWCMAQLGWIAGTVSLLIFAIITWYTSILLADCYTDSVTGKRNYTYMEAVNAILGKFQNKLCGVAQHSMLIGSSIGYTFTAAISMAAIHRSNYFHKHGHDKEYHVSNNPYIVAFAVIQIILSQIPNFQELAPLSNLAALMAFGYSSIGIGLSIGKIAEGGNPKTSLTGIPAGDMPSIERMWNVFSALGNIAFAYSFSSVLIEIQDTLKSSPPENKVMKWASSIGISISTIFYMLAAILGYVAFGHEAPGNFLTGFGFYEPFWLVDLGNALIVIHLFGTYQVYIQPVFALVETWSQEKWPESKFITREYSIAGRFKINYFRLIWRTIYTILTTLVAMLLPFFNDFFGLLGSITFWPLTVYFPVEMYIRHNKVPRFSVTWIWLQVLSLVCLIVSLLAAAGSTRGLISSVQNFKLFQSVS